MWYAYELIVDASSYLTCVGQTDTFIKLIAGLASCTYEELGYDSTVMRIPTRIHGDPQYAMRVGQKTYITVKTFSDYAACAITGRGTRVFEAYEEGGSSETRMTLKDTWMDMNALSEGQILRDGFLAMDGCDVPSDTEDYHKYFLTPLTDEVVKLRNGQGVQEDDTRVARRNRPIDESTERYYTNQFTLRSRQPRSHGFPCSPDDFPLREAVRQIRDLKHYRIVFAECGIFVHHLPDLKSVFMALRDACKGESFQRGCIACTHLFVGLRWLFRAGYVHRDVSAENIQMVGVVGKLAGLEYCKMIEPPSPIVGKSTGISDDTVNAVAVSPEHKTVSRHYIIVMCVLSACLREPTSSWHGKFQI